MHQIKMSKEAHVWLPIACKMVKQVYIDHTACAKFTKRQLLKCSTLFFSCLLLVVDNEASSIIVCVIKMREKAYEWLPAVLCKMVKQVYIDDTPCAPFTERWVLQCPPLSSSCLFLVVTQRRPPSVMVFNEFYV
jgi:hypothetical protein